MCVGVCLCVTIKWTSPFTDKPRDKQNGQGSEGLFIGSACAVPQPSRCPVTRGAIKTTERNTGRALRSRLKH